MQNHDTTNDTPGAVPERERPGVDVFVRASCQRCGGTRKVTIHAGLDIVHLTVPCPWCDEGLSFVALTPETCPGHQWVTEVQPFDPEGGWFGVLGADDDDNLVGAEYVICRWCGAHPNEVQP